MPKTVNVPGIGQVDYPDNWTDEQIDRHIEGDLLPNLGPKQQPGFMPSLKRGALGNWNLMTRGLGALAAEAVGADETAVDLAESYKAKEAYLNYMYPREVGSLEDVKDIGTFGTYAKEALAENLPSLAISMGTGGAGMYVGKKLAERGLVKTVEGMTRKQIIEKAMITGGVAGATVGSGALNIPESYMSTEDVGAGLIAGIGKTALDVLPASRFLQRALNIGPQKASEILWKRLTKGAGEGAAMESVTEGVQEAIDVAAEHIMDKNPDLFSKENMWRVLDSAFAGGLLGGTVGGLTSIRGPAREEAPPSESSTRGTEPQVEEAISAEEQVIESAAPALVAVRATSRKRGNTQQGFAQLEANGEPVLDENGNPQGVWLPRDEDKRAAALEEATRLANEYNKKVAGLSTETLAQTAGVDVGRAGSRVSLDTLKEVSNRGNGEARYLLEQIAQKDMLLGRQTPDNFSREDLRDMYGFTDDVSESFFAGKVEGAALPEGELARIRTEMNDLDTLIENLPKQSAIAAKKRQDTSIFTETLTKAQEQRRILSEKMLSINATTPAGRTYQLDAAIRQATDDATAAVNEANSLEAQRQAALREVNAVDYRSLAPVNAFDTAKEREEAMRLLRQKAINNVEAGYLPRIAAATKRAAALTKEHESLKSKRIEVEQVVIPDSAPAPMDPFPKIAEREGWTQLDGKPYTTPEQLQKDADSIEARLRATPIDKSTVKEADLAAQLEKINTTLASEGFKAYVARQGWTAPHEMGEIPAPPEKSAVEAPAINEKLWAKVQEWAKQYLGADADRIQLVSPTTFKRILEGQGATLTGQETGATTKVVKMNRLMALIADFNGRTDNEYKYTVLHEVAHLLDDLGLLHPNTVKFLKDNKMRLEFVIKKAIDKGAKINLGIAVSDPHETWAYAVEAYTFLKDARENIPGLSGKLRRVLNNITQFMTRVYNALRGQGYRTAEDILAGVERGGYTSRERAVEPDTTATRFARKADSEEKRLEELIARTRRVDPAEAAEYEDVLKKLRQERQPQRYQRSATLQRVDSMLQSHLRNAVDEMKNGNARASNAWVSTLHTAITLLHNTATPSTLNESVNFIARAVPALNNALRPLAATVKAELPNKMQFDATRQQMNKIGAIIERAPAATKLQRVARDVSIDIANGNFEGAVAGVLELNNIIEDKNFIYKDEYNKEESSSDRLRQDLGKLDYTLRSGNIPRAFRLLGRTPQFPLREEIKANINSRNIREALDLVKSSMLDKKVRFQRGKLEDNKNTQDKLNVQFTDLNSALWRNDRAGAIALLDTMDFRYKDAVSIPLHEGNMRASASALHSIRMGGEDPAYIKYLQDITRKHEADPNAAMKSMPWWQGATSVIRSLWNPRTGKAEDYVSGFGRMFLDLYTLAQGNESMSRFVVRLDEMDKLRRTMDADQVKEIEAYGKLSYDKADRVFAFAAVARAKYMKVDKLEFSLKNDTEHDLKYFRKDTTLALDAEEQAGFKALVRLYQMQNIKLLEYFNKFISGTPEETEKLSKAVRERLHKNKEEFKKLGVIEPGSTKEMRTAAEAVRSALESKIESDEMLLNMHKIAPDMVGQIKSRASLVYVPFGRFGTHFISVTSKTEKDSEGRPKKLYTRMFNIKGLDRFEQNKMLQDTIKWATDHYKGATVSSGQVNTETLKRHFPDFLETMDSVITMLPHDAEDMWRDLRNIVSKKFGDMHKPSFLKQAMMVPGFDEDGKRQVFNQMHHFSSWYAKMTTSSDIRESITHITDTATRNYANETYDYVMNPVEEHQWARQVAFLYLLTDVGAAAVNMFQILASMAFASNYAGSIKTMGYFTKALTDTLRLSNVSIEGVKQGMLLDFNRIAEVFKDVPGIQDALKRGDLFAGRTADAIGMTPYGSTRLGHTRAFTSRVTTALSAVFSTSETMNRIITYVAMQRLMRDNPHMLQKALNHQLANNTFFQAKVDRAFQGNRDALFDPKNMNVASDLLAQIAVDETQFLNGRHVRPKYMRGWGSVMWQFNQFYPAYMGFIKRLLMNYGPEGKAAFARLMFGLVAFAGVWGLPFAGNIKDLIELIMKTVRHERIDLDSEMQRILAEMTDSNFIADVILKGGLRKTGIDISNRIGLGQAPLITELLDAAGGRGTIDRIGPPVTSVATNLVDAFQSLNRGDKATALSKLPWPKQVRDVLEAIAWNLNGVRTRDGAPVIPGEQIGKFDTAIRTLGMQPTSVTTERDIRYAQRVAQDPYADLRDLFYARLGRADADLIRASQDRDTNKVYAAQQRILNIYEELRDHNANLAPEQRNSYIKISPSVRRRHVLEELGHRPAEFVGKTKRPEVQAISKIYD